MRAITPHVVRIRTDTLPAEARTGYWESRSAEVLVGLKCVAFDGEGLHATQTNLDLHGMRLAEIAGNAHVIERSAPLVQAHPKEAVFASLVLQSHAFFYHGKGCIQVEPGDLVVYDTRRPYLFGFAGAMQQYLFDIPLARFRERCLPQAPDAPLHVRTPPEMRWASAALRRLAATALRAPAQADANAVRETACDLLASLLGAREGGRSATGAAHLFAARCFIGEHLRDPRLDAAAIAAACGVSVRHLARLFAGQGMTVMQYVMRERLAGARAELAQGRRGVAQTAYRWGFVSAAHFARAFRREFGIAPSEALAGGGENRGQGLGRADLPREGA